MPIDFEEIFRGEKVIIKLTKKNIAELLNGKILNGFKTEIGLEESE